MQIFLETVLAGERGVVTAVFAAIGAGIGLRLVVARGAEVLRDRRVTRLERR